MLVAGLSLDFPSDLLSPPGSLALPLFFGGMAVAVAMDGGWVGTGESYWRWRVVACADVTTVVMGSLVGWGLPELMCE